MPRPATTPRGPRFVGGRGKFAPCRSSRAHSAAQRLPGLFVLAPEGRKALAHGASHGTRTRERKTFPSPGGATQGQALDGLLTPLTGLNWLGSATPTACAVGYILPPL